MTIARILMTNLRFAFFWFQLLLLKGFSPEIWIYVKVKSYLNILLSKLSLKLVKIARILRTNLRFAFFWLRLVFLKGFSFEILNNRQINLTETQLFSSEV